MKQFLDKRRAARHQRRKRDEIKQLVRFKATQLSIELDDRVLNNNTSGVGNDCCDDIIVTLTSHSHRIDSVYLSIESLMRQTLKADKIVLNLCADRFNQDNLPDTLKRQQDRGLEIYFVPRDLGPYTKYYYTLSRYPNALMVTVDDDVLYPIDMLSKLYQAYRLEPDLIHCHRAHEIKLTADGKLAPYKSWPKNGGPSSACWSVFPTGVGGVMYFPGCFHNDVLNPDKFMQLAPKADDIWLKAMSIAKQVRCKKIYDSRNWELRFPTIPDSQLVTLKRGNKDKKSGNDAKLAAVFDHYRINPVLGGEY